MKDIKIFQKKQKKKKKKQQYKSLSKNEKQSLVE